MNKVVSLDETIVAISTPLGRSGVGVVRLSGREAIGFARRFFKYAGTFKHRTAMVGGWMNAASEIIDDVVVTYFRGPESYTGEDVVEISAHGNPLILARIIEDIRIAGARLAMPGEFTLRAVTHGKMDLIQAEAVREFIEAQTEQQARTARRQLEGSVSKRIRPAKEILIDVVARLEAGIDFAEDDIEVPDNTTTVGRIESIIQNLLNLQESFHYGRILTGGLRLAIVGKPNVGKSTLFNRLVAADRAIVTDVPGTTRDVLTETVQIEGVPIRFADTAGIRDTTDLVESMGVGRSYEALSDAHFVLAVLDGASELDDDDTQVLKKIEGLRHVIVMNKCDLPRVNTLTSNGAAVISVSAKSGDGVGLLQEAIRGFLLEQKGDVADDFILTSIRQNEAISGALERLAAAVAALKQSLPHELVLVDLYESLAALNELTGETVTDDILDRIFSTFCVGK